MKFSIVCPVYNSEKYLSAAIDSVLEQDYINWELVLVDDGSLDNSREIMSEYAERDSRIRLVHQDNSGPGAARNAGIEHSTGDYLVFLDSDDRLVPNYLSRLEPLANANDLVFIDVLQVDEYGNAIAREEMSKFSHLDKDRLLRWQLTGKIPWGGVRKAVSRELVNSYNIRYSQIDVGEEAIFSFRVLDSAKKFAFLDGSSYLYFNRADSQSKKRIEDPWGPTVKVLRDYLVGTNREDMYHALVSFDVTATIVSVDRITEMFTSSERRAKARERLLACKAAGGGLSQLDFDCLTNKARLMLPFVFLGWAWPITVASRLKSVLSSIRP